MYIMFESGSKHCHCLVGLESTQDEHDKSQLKGNLTKMSVNFNSRLFPRLGMPSYLISRHDHDDPHNEQGTVKVYTRGSTSTCQDSIAIDK